jgi:CBS domain-containing protein
MINRQTDKIVRGRPPVTMRGSETVRAAFDHMLDHKIGAVIVTDDRGRLAGIFTGRDLVRVVRSGLPPGTTPVEAVMTRDPRTMRLGRSATEALRLMEDGGFRHLPLMDGDRVARILARGDFRGLEVDHLADEARYWEIMR